ncbi:uncharacterized protein LOC108671394 [Hyalella azteca]|uniref:Uncharacterized protein LOC108671394 n=1 Tax=Hyalella azteca TaxID=294128 RepID=A0A8B7NMK3_HYAAZ|nr:uncharacterized protein LOC108671394 [Hyalella azteca]
MLRSGAAWVGESGVSVLARAADRPSVAALNPILFPQLSSGQCVQVSGDAGSGCSLLLYDLLASALLPSCWRGVELGGCGAHAALLDTDLRFCVLQLSVIAEARVRRKLRAVRIRLKSELPLSDPRQTTSPNTPGEICAELPLENKVTPVECNQDVKYCNAASCSVSGVAEPRRDKSTDVFDERKSGGDSSREFTLQGSSDCSRLAAQAWILKTSRAKLKRLIKDLLASCLANFLYLKCTYSAQFATTLLSLDTLLATHPKVSLICVDSLSNFYWHDRSFDFETWKNTEQYYNKITKFVMDCVAKNGVILVGVQQILFAKQKQHSERSGSDPESDYEHYDFLGKCWAGGVRYKVNIKRTRGCGRRDFVVSEPAKAPRTVKALFRAEGITWLSSE